MNEWTADKIDTLRQMWANGATFSQIGMALHRSRSAIAGKVRRLKLPKRGADHLRAVNAQNAAKRWENTAHKPKSRHFSLKRTSPKERKPPMHLRVVSVPESKPVPLMERTGCCFPTTSDRPHLFCDLPLGRGAYCQTHYKVMYPRSSL